MKIIGIVAEYNPFHKGHAYQINQSLESLKADGVVAIMSGNFVQRGLPAFLDKWTRTKMALSAGVNLVLELPTFYATSSAEQFAHGAITLLNATGIVTHLSFGSETDSLNQLSDLASILADEPLAYKEKLSEQLSKGLSFPKARSNALDQLYDLDCSLNHSNMILGLEYLKSIKKSGSSIKPFLVKRLGSGYHDKDLHAEFPSATAIRKAYFDAPDSFKFDPHVPEGVARVLREGISHPVNMTHFENELLTLIRRSSPESLQHYREVTEGLNHKIMSLANQVTSYDELVDGLKSKRYTQTKINRMLLNILLGIKKDSYDLSSLGYLRILGFDETGRMLAHQMKTSATLPLVTNINKMTHSLKNNPLLKLDLLASDIYALSQSTRLNRVGGRDHTQKIIMK